VAARRARQRRTSQGSGAPTRASTRALPGRAVAAPGGSGDRGRLRAKRRRGPRPAPLRRLPLRYSRASADTNSAPATRSYQVAAATRSRLPVPVTVTVTVTVTQRVPPYRAMAGSAEPGRAARAVRGSRDRRRTGCTRRRGFRRTKVLIHLAPRYRRQSHDLLGTTLQYWPSVHYIRYDRFIPCLPHCTAHCTAPCESLLCRPVG